MSNKTYDTLKKIALLIVPIGTFIAAMCVTWGLPYAEQITQTAAALDTLCGAIVTISAMKYTDKSFNDEADEGTEVNE